MVGERPGPAQRVNERRVDGGRRGGRAHPVDAEVGEPIEEALDKAGIPFDGITAVALSHFHVDHAGASFTGRVPVHAQTREHTSGLSGDPAVEAHAIHRVDFDGPRIDWRLADGDAEIATGVMAVATPGHTPGHQSFVVEIDESVGGGGFVFAFDAADLTENIQDELATAAVSG